MQRMRDVIRGSLARSLRLLSDEDRLSAALPVACGSVLAAHCEVATLDQGRVLHLQVDSQEWMASLLGMREILQHDLQRVSGVSLSGLHFLQAGSASDSYQRSPVVEQGQTQSGTRRPARRYPSARTQSATKERPA